MTSRGVTHNKITWAGVGEGRAGGQQIVVQMETDVRLETLRKALQYLEREGQRHVTWRDLCCSLCECKLECHTGRAGSTVDSRATNPCS